MVTKRLYALEESCSGRDLDQSIPLSACIRRGMKINMSMVFVNAKIIQGICPRCKTAVDSPKDALVNW